MAFVLQPMQHEDLDLIYSEHMAEEAYKASKDKKTYWPQDMNGMNWALDVERNAFLLQLPMDRERGYFAYLFGYLDGYVRLNMAAPCEFKVDYISKTLLGKSNEVTALIVDAFRCSGLWMDGAQDADTGLPVPNAIIVGL